MTPRLETAVYRCGVSEIDIGRRQLSSGGVTVALGGRAFEILELLVQSAGKLVTKREIIGSVWPCTTVGENTLHVHVTAIRKALGRDRHLLKTVAGRGYLLLGNWTTPSPTGVDSSHDRAPVVRDSPILSDPIVVGAAAQPGATGWRNLPIRHTQPVGREAAVHAIRMKVMADRFVTVTGPGGIGKTTVAVTTAHALFEIFHDAVCFVDLGPVSDPPLAVFAVASALGLEVQSQNPIFRITSFLRDKEMLLILDSCEHLIGAVAEIASELYLGAPRVHIIATSREALRVEGEQVYQLSPLEIPAKEDGLTAVEALQFSAVQCFVQRATAGDSTFTLTDSDAPAVVGICRTLDGVALAIELAAGTVAALGVQETAWLLKGRFHLHFRGSGTAEARHQTLAAALDWSHALLSDNERIVLRRLSIFVGFFIGLEPAIAVAAGEGLDEGCVVNSTADLIAKSLVTTDFSGPVIRYRLLDTTRAYALNKLAASGEAMLVAARHASWFRDLLTRENAEAQGQGEAATSMDQIDNVRAALEWSFAQSDRELATSLASAAAPLFLRLSLLSECYRWMELAIAALDHRWQGTHREMELQASLGVSLMFTKGNRESVRTAFGRSLTIAEAIGSLDRQVQLLSLLNIFYLRLGDYRTAFVHAERANSAAQQCGDHALIAATSGLIGSNLNLLGRNAEALQRLTDALRYEGGEGRKSGIHLGYNYRGHARISLALTLWFTGYADQAVRVAAQTVEEAAATRHPTGLCLALLYAASVLMWARDYGRAEHYIEAFIEHAHRHSLTPYIASGLGMKAEIALFRGHAQDGVDTLRRSLEALRQDHYSMRIAIFSTSLAEGLRSLGRFDEAVETIDAEMRRAERFGDLVAMPEMLRVKGEVLASMPGTEHHQAEAVLLQSLELAQSQSALSLELRAAMSLAREQSRNGTGQDYVPMLASVYGRFTEGFGTPDMRTARRMLDAVGLG